MAAGLVLRFPGLTRAEYEAVNNKLNIDMNTGAGDWAGGLLSHAGGEADGALVVIEIWESREAQGRFMQGQLGRALHDAGVTVMPEITWVDLIAYHTPGKVPA